MQLSNNQLELVKKIQEKLKYGDIKVIAEATGFSREYVGKALNITYDFYNEEIIDKAVEIIAERDAKAAKQLETIG